MLSTLVIEAKIHGMVKKARVKILNHIIALLKEGPKTEEEVLKIIMKEYWVSKITAQRYIEDLIFMGKVTRNNNHLKLVNGE